MAHQPLSVSEHSLGVKRPMGASAAPSAQAFSAQTLSILAYFCFVVAMLGLMWFAPRAHQNVAVLASPFADPSEATALAARTHAEVVDRSRWPNLLIVSPTEPDTVARLYASGAWLVFNPNAIVGCFEKV